MFEDIAARLHSRDEDKDLDIVVFGATGFTGEFVVKEVWRTLSQIETSLGRPLRWAIAGRSEEKLRQVLARLKQQYASTEEATNTTAVKSPQLLVADVTSVPSCVGPYRLYGEPVVKACVEQGAHYVDITGEPAFILQSIEKYGEQAHANNVSIVHACGYDSIPAEMGILKTIHALEVQHAVPTVIESFYTFPGSGSGALINSGTYQTAIHEMSHLGEIIQLEQAVDKKYPVTYAVAKPSSWLPIGIETRIAAQETNRGFFGRLFPFHWTAPYPLTDGSITEMSRRLIAQQKLAIEAKQQNLSGGAAAWAALTSVFRTSNSKRKDKKKKNKKKQQDDGKAAKQSHYRRKTPPPAVHYVPRMLLPFYALPVALIAMGWAAWITILAQIPFMQRQLLRYPRLFTAGVVSSNGPTLETIEATGFRQQMMGYGYRQVDTAGSADSDESKPSTVQVEVTVTGPNPGYPGTAICLIQSAYVLLDRKEKKRIPSGVLTPAAAFWKTDLADRLHEHGVTFDVKS
ncbi:Saccharopine dehydrogenase-domain-containing protein [Syncephalis fuscata]|nr:Saccharopine dehydrogenase-domain-containing protein [Syncephalis fuscata]